MFKKWIIKRVPLAFLVLLLPTQTVHAVAFYEPQVGAWAENDSIGNVGVSVEIETHILTSSQGDLQAFWVGDILSNGAFIQFGYSYEPGLYCLKGQTTSGQFTCTGAAEQIGTSDARWFWQYWPNAYGSRDFSYDNGPANSVGVDKTWHKYAIIPDTNGGWDFVLDGKVVDSISNHWSPSKVAAHFVAEKGSRESTPSQLGPVRFMNLAYLKFENDQYKWYVTKLLYAYSSCGYGTVCPTNPYGVSAENSGITIAGSGVRQPTSSTVLWSSIGQSIPPPTSTSSGNAIPSSGEIFPACIPNGGWSNDHHIPPCTTHPR